MKPTDDPERDRVLCEELERRLNFIAASYSFFKEVSEYRMSYNDSIESIKRSLRRKRNSSLKHKRLHALIETDISMRAKELAAAEDREVTGSDVREAATQFISTAKKLKGRPKNEILQYHVVGLIALLQQFYCESVVAHREKCGVYEPHFVPGISQLVPEYFAVWDPDVTLTSLVECAISVRKAFAGKNLSFLDVFPTYGATIGPDGNPQLRSGLKLVSFEENLPLYSR